MSRDGPAFVSVRNTVEGMKKAGIKACHELPPVKDGTYVYCRNPKSKQHMLPVWLPHDERISLEHWKLLDPEAQAKLPLHQWPEDLSSQASGSDPSDP